MPEGGDKGCTTRWFEIYISHYLIIDVNKILKVLSIRAHMQFQIEHAERKLAPVPGTNGCQPCLFHLAQSVGRYFLAWIPVINSKTVKHGLVPDPVFEHL